MEEKLLSDAPGKVTFFNLLLPSAAGTDRQTYSFSRSVMSMKRASRALGLFSGGLDSILAIKLVQEQGIEVTGLHCVSPFFGKPDKVPYWRGIYGLEIEIVDVSADFVSMLARGPEHGFGSVFNPCVDCKILMLKRVRAIKEACGADFIISGEVLGQRPMSQRRDTLNIIRRDAGVKDMLLRPLSARHLDQTEAELLGLIDRERLLGISGRGRKDQMILAKRMALPEIPTPGGGCRLTEKENARSYWPVLAYTPSPTVADFSLANTGRQYWHVEGEGGAFRLVIGRNQEDNTKIMQLASERDILFKIGDFPGPIGLGRFFGTEWPPEAVFSAAAFIASYSAKAVLHAGKSLAAVAVRLHPGSLDAPGQVVQVQPNREPYFSWKEFSWDACKDAIKARALRTRDNVV
jgi:hypothetical protein